MHWYDIVSLPFLYKGRTFFRKEQFRTTYEWTEDEEEFNDWNRIDRGQQERDGKFAQDIHPQTDKRVFARQYALQPDLAQQMEKFREKDKKAYGF